MFFPPTLLYFGRSGLRPSLVQGLRPRNAPLQNHLSPTVFTLPQHRVWRRESTPPLAASTHRPLTTAVPRPRNAPPWLPTLLVLPHHRGMPAVHPNQPGGCQPNTPYESLTGGGDEKLVKTDTVCGLVVTTFLLPLVAYSQDWRDSTVRSVRPRNGDSAPLTATCSGHEKVWPLSG